MANNILKSKSFDFALKIIQVFKEISYKHKEYVLSKQLLRSGTAIGALIRESEFAQSKPDFISKLSISLKEANETEYWILLLKESNFVDSQTANELLINVKEIISILVSSIKTAKKFNKPK
jgi:four helix bundle protein